MASFTELLNLEGLMFLCAVCGIVIKRRKILPDNAREVLTDLVMNLILAAKYGGDYVFAGKCVILSTVLSLFTIPLWCFIMSM